MSQQDPPQASIPEKHVTMLDGPNEIINSHDDGDLDDDDMDPLLQSMDEAQSHAEGGQRTGENNHNNHVDNEKPQAPDAKEIAKLTAQQDYTGFTNRINNLRTAQKVFPLSMFHYLSIAFKAGYNIEPTKRKITFAAANNNMDLSRFTQGYQLGLVIRKIHSFKTHIFGLVKPFIRVHALDYETGFYIKSKDIPPAKPVFTSSKYAINSCSSAIWNEEVILSADFGDIVNENTILLFELLDERPSLSLSKNLNQNNLSVYKKIAWSYLLPIGNDGQLNVGIFKRSKPDKPLSPRRNDEKQVQVTDNEPNSSSFQEASNEISTHSNPPIQVDTTFSKPPPLDLSISPKLPAPATPSALSESYKDTTTDTNLKLQLYYYREFEDIIGWIQRRILMWPKFNPKYEGPEEPSYPSNIPPIFLQFKLLKQNKIKGAFLNISAGSRLYKAPQLETVEGEGDLDSDSERMSTKKDRENKQYVYKSGRKKRRKVLSKEEKSKLRAAALRRSRGPKDPCLVPDRFLYRLNVGPDGAMVVTFSNSGHLLAIASRTTVISSTLSQEEIIYSLRLFDSDWNEEIFLEDAAHHSVIYDIKWSKNDRYLLTCSGDGTCKIWDFFALTEPIQNQARYQSTGQPQQAKRSQQEDDNHTLLTGVISDDETLSPTPKMSNRSIRPKLIHILQLGASVHAYCGIFQELQPNHNSNNPTYNPLLTSFDDNIWKDQINALRTSKLPRIIIGAVDGKLRVFDEGVFKGYISVVDKSESGEKQDFSPHDGAVNSLVIDERSKYLLSADSFGDILAWRLDSNGWYQLLRKFKKETPINTSSFGSSFDSGSILSLNMHPDKHKGLMLVLSRQPATLKILNMASYKPLCHCEGYSGMSAYLIREEEDAYSTGVFYRANFSADGRYVICGSNMGNDKDLYRLLVWDAYTGHLVSSPLSKLTFPYPIRSVSWHPSQHLLAVAMVGPGAAVICYSTEKESSIEMIDRIQAENTFMSQLPAGYRRPNENTSKQPISPIPDQPYSSFPPDQRVDASSNSEFNYSLLDRMKFSQEGINVNPNVKASLLGSSVNSSQSQTSTPIGKSGLSRNNDTLTPLVNTVNNPNPNKPTPPKTNYPGDILELQAIRNSKARDLLAKFKANKANEKGTDSSSDSKK